MRDEIGKHLVCGFGFALQVFQHFLFAFGSYNVNLNRLSLTEAPAAAHALVILLEAVRRKESYVVAVLEVQAPCANFWLRYQHAKLTGCEGEEQFLFAFV